MNDGERREWVLNDEGLYNWYRGSRQTMKEFIKENREELTRLINGTVDNNRTCHNAVDSSGRDLGYYKRGDHRTW